MRKKSLFYPAAALVFLAAGCGEGRKEGDAAAPEAPVERRSHQERKPIPKSQTFYAAQDFVKQSAEDTGSTPDPGRVFFDGERLRPDGTTGAGVSMPPAGGPQGKTVAYTAAPRSRSLEIEDPPSPVSARPDKKGSGPKASGSARQPPAPDAWVGSDPAARYASDSPAKDASGKDLPTDPACGPDMAALTGNVTEWVSRTPGGPGKYPHHIKGCYWSGCFRGVPSCGFSNTSHPGEFRSYEAGFRCCKDR